MNVNLQFNSKGVINSSSGPIGNSTWTLLFVNLATIGVALVQGWDLKPLMWVYWFQSVVIGLFQFKKMLELKNFTTENFRINGRSVEPTESTKRQTAYFFLLHYGIFHVVYFGFLLKDGLPDNLVWILLLGLSFVVNHYFSYKENKERDSQRIRNIGSMMFLPYARIIPMHLVIIFGEMLFAGAALVVFLGLKTMADVIMHVAEHRSGQVQSSQTTQ